MTKTIGKQYYLEKSGKKRTICRIFGHGWEMSMSSGGPGDSSENYESYYCANPRCNYRQHVFENYPDLSEEDKIAEISKMRGTVGAIVWLLDGGE